MPTATKPPAKSRGMRRSILPYAPRRNSEIQIGDKTQSLWPFYLVPWFRPDVSPECEDFVMGEYEPENEDELQLLLSELVNCNTVRGDANMAITQQPGSCAAVRQDYALDGFQLISPISGEADGELKLWEPQKVSGHSIGRNLTDPFIGLEDVIADLTVRQRWQLAQIDAKIVIATEQMKEGDGETKRYQRSIVAALRRRRTLVANGLPTVPELQLWFKRFELQRLESTQDVKLKQAQATQGRIDDQSREVARLTSEIAASGTSWPPAGSEPAE